MNKPKIFAHCPAGCEWETVHRKDIEAIAALFPVTSDGILERGKTYRINKTVEGTTEWGFKISTEGDVPDGQGNINVCRHDISIPCESYEDYLHFRWLDMNFGFKDGGDGVICSVIVEINGIRQTIVVYESNDNSQELYHKFSRIVLTGATAGAWVFNESARLTADKTFIRYSANADGEGFTEEWSEGQNYIGIATGQEAPTDKGEYEWVRFTADLNLAVTAMGGSVAQRKENGTLAVAYAIEDNDAVPLGQMNGALASKADDTDLADLASRVSELENNSGGSATVSLVDDAVAYNKRVPSNALPVAAITEIGGATVHVESLLDPDAWAKFEGQTIDEEYGNGKATIRENGEIYVENTSGCGCTSSIELPVKVCDLFPNAVMGVSYEIHFYSKDTTGGYGASVGVPGYDYGAFTMNEQLYNSNLIVSTVYYEERYWNEEAQYEECYMYDDNITYYDIQLVPKGKEVGKYYDTKVTGVSVTGRNLWPFKAGTTTQCGVTVTIDDDGTITLNGKCTASYGALVSRPISVQAGKKYILRDFAEGTFPNDSNPRVSVSNRMNNALHYMLVGNNGDLSNAMGILDSTEVTLLIKPKYGYTYNNCKLRPMLVSGVDEPKEFIPYKKQDFPIPTAVQVLPAYGYSYDSELYNRIIFNEDSVVYQQRVTTERTPLSPYVETDITDLMNWDGFFEAEAGGAITFTNQKSDPVPSTVVYQLK